MSGTMSMWIARVTQHVSRPYEGICKWCSPQTIVLARGLEVYPLSADNTSTNNTMSFEHVTVTTLS